MMDDMELLKEYATRDSEAAFAKIVARHLNLVHSVALRHVGNPHQAEEITQAVFVILARKAGRLREGTVLSAWLFHTARLTAANFLRTEIRRARREQEAFMQSHMPDHETDEAWRQMAPLLDEAIASLGEADRNAVVLRFVEGRQFKDVGTALGTTEDSVRMRIKRALEKLRKFFTKRGITLSAAAIAGALSANAVQAAPSALAATVTALAAAKGISVSASTATLIKGTLKVMAWTKLKTTVVVGAAFLLTAGTATLAYKQLSPAGQPDPAASVVDASDPRVKNIIWAADPKVLDNEPPIIYLRPAGPASPNSGSGGGGAGGVVMVNGGSSPPRELNIAALARYGGPFRIGDHGSGSAGSSDGNQWAWKDGKAITLNVHVVRLLQYAYNFERLDHVILPADLPQDRFDVLVGIPQGGRDEIQNLLKDRFGLTAKHELRSVDTLALKFKTANAPGLKLSESTGRGGGGGGSSVTNGMLKLHATGTTMAGLARDYETRLNMPVVDLTGLTAIFDLDYTLPAPGPEFTVENVNRAIQEQLGLELVPTDKQSIDYLVVEMSK